MTFAFVIAKNEAICLLNCYILYVGLFICYGSKENKFDSKNLLIKRVKEKINAPL